MIYAETWIPGTDKYLDDLFESLRHTFYTSQNHSLWSNYNKEHFKTCDALTISFQNDQPLFCASILSRNIWPDGVYRIMNRYWRIGENLPLIKKISEGTAAITKNQIQWLKENTNFELAFISRQYDNWQRYVIEQYKTHYQIDFKKDNYNYCTCENLSDDTCWQKIVYIGNEDVLTHWTRR